VNKLRSKRRRISTQSIGRSWLFGALAIMALGLSTMNCSFCPRDLNPGGTYAATGSAREPSEITAEKEDPKQEPQQTGEQEGEVLSEELWADAIINDNDQPRPTNEIPDYMSLDVRDANLLDVLSLIAYKLDGNIIFLEEPTEITIKTSELSPITTLQTVLQKEGLDYLTIGRNYIVGERDRLYEDFANRMYLSRFNLFYVSGEAMQGFIDEFDVPVESLTVDENRQSIWMQGTPMALGKAREVINSLDVMENAAFGEGGTRQIRMPVAIASGATGEEELRSLINFLSILLDGFRDERSDLGWGTWDHPGPVPRIHMDWDSPVIRPYDLKMKITPDLDPNPGSYLHYLICEGTPDNIEIVNQMIESIRATSESPFPFAAEEVPEEEELDDNLNELLNNTNNNQGGQPESQSAPATAYNVSLDAVPSAGGSLSGRGAYIEGTSVTVTASPNQDYQFVRWIENGSELSTSPSYTFTINSNRNLEAVFSKAGNEQSDQPAEAEDNDDNME